ncbi:MAG: UbiX family flavin prenyltransferase [Chloroflexi bacterium]|nr:UbiX family flavin prenyltransferase [Chloroflexota bacterium]MCI0800557.1 UbiX family flavin prenyltransferase [Chloroflexota bacterium]MCI0809920.1 UbiX family flavin prenyltransferase [Chloroflexota bacterium]MCI0828800.1 UbiX family flavin prenyltransferase [Chloroflexota bacterium]MCI0847585.1 UbiX family flavin prenyltransferase [Chloroflexota bacterium]
MKTKPVVVGITGASGSVMARATVDALLRRDIPTVALCSNAARLVWQEEMDENFNDTLIEWQEHPAFVHYPINDLRAPVASGTYPTAGMVIVPASMNSIASLAGGLSGNLLLRSADVCLKERRPLVLVPRETPLHSIHLNNMLTLSRMGAVVIPPEPAFYLKPKGIGDIVDFVVARIFVALGLDQAMPENMQYQGPEA